MTTAPRHVGWQCEKCGTRGTIGYAADDTVYDVASLLRFSHRSHAPATCETDLARLLLTDESEEARCQREYGISAADLRERVESAQRGEVRSHADVMRDLRTPEGA